MRMKPDTSNTKPKSLPSTPTQNEDAGPERNFFIKPDIITRIETGR